MSFSGYYATMTRDELIAECARLRVHRDALLCMAGGLLSECAECGGAGISIDTGKDCESCIDIRAAMKQAPTRRAVEGAQMNLFLATEAS